jgi:hypothetical protein
LHAELNVLRLTFGPAATMTEDRAGMLNKIFTLVTGTPLEADPGVDGTTALAAKRAVVLFETSGVQLLEWVGSFSERIVDPDTAPKQIGVSVLTLQPGKMDTARPPNRL